MKRESYDLLLKVARGFWFCLFACLLVLAGRSWGEPGKTAEEMALDNLISVYFTSWSKPDMQAYKDCFHPQASVYFIDGSGNPHPYQLEEFLAGQARVQLGSRKPLSERPTKTSLAVGGRLGQAEVRWELQRDSTKATGTDYFIFVKTGTGWKILSLAYEQDKP